jgi:hypothetical protein
MSPEESAQMMQEWEARIAFEHKFLNDHGWTLDEKERIWHGPKGEQIPNAYTDAYDHLTGNLLLANGWKTIVEVERWGKLEWNKPLQKWARYQSPKTNRVYSFLEAQYVMEKDWDENQYPDFCSLHTIEVNKLLGENFQDRVFHTWFYLTEYGTNNPKHTLELWHPNDNEVLQYDEDD